MDPIEEVEKWREAKLLIPADMARLFGVASQNYNNWVYRGSLPKAYYKKAREITGDTLLADSNVSEPIPIRGWIPLISYIQAGEWSEAIDLYEPGYAERISPTTVPHSRVTFALRVEGGSMTLPAGIEGRSFPPGMIIYIDPEREAAPRDYVVARCFGDNRATFKQLMLEEGRPVLVPLNPNREIYPIIRGEFEILGRVIDASWGGL